ncbi:PDC sensor domain-containing protein [Cysteiniphilum halobium]|uniref:PDC sensor domain-containing protein n=1 Tax=Cysteiniphilum halobium TaxID=2219059 RepID=UPI000E651EFA|nr:PDC sensor domain-containing protein [Cysteiniphilum halobium]
MKQLKALILSVMLVILVACSNQDKEALSKSDIETGKYADVLKSHLAVRQAQLSELFASNRIIQTLMHANKRLAEQRPLSETRYQAIDQNMQKMRDTYNVQLLLYNACAVKLKQFQAEHPAFVEIFVTDLSGMNVCQTNMTTDFYQADEKWWQVVYHNGVGKLYYGEIEYDGSASEVVVPIYMPIYAHKKLIGIAKTLVAIEDIKLTEFN